MYDIHSKSEQQFGLVFWANFFNIAMVHFVTLIKVLYFIHTEIYSVRSYDVNFHTQMSSGQSEGRTMFFTCEKNDTFNQKPQRCVSFTPKSPLFIGTCSLQRPRFTSCFADDIQRGKTIK